MRWVWQALGVGVLVWGAVAALGADRTPAPAAPAESKGATMTSPAPADRYPLAARPDGTWVYEGPRFTAVVERDGRVIFHDHHAAVAPGPMRDVLAGRKAAEQPQGELVAPAGRPTPPAYPPPETGRASDQPGPAPERLGQPDSPSMRRLPPQPPLVSGVLSFDLGDELMRRHGHDPYDQQKADFLAVTRTFRLQTAARQEDAAARIALGHLPDDLDALWASPDLTEPQKRAVLRELLAETGDTPFGRDARNVIRTFLRNHPPRR